MMRLLANADMQMADALVARLHEEAPEYAITWLDKDGNPQGPVDDATVFFRFNMSTKALVHALQAAPRLKWLHTRSAGVDRFHDLVRQHAPPDLIFSNGSGTMAPAIAEFCLAEMFAIVKDLPDFIRAQERHDWIGREKRPTMRDLRGSRLLVLGLGSIGSYLARIAHAVGVQVWGMRRTPVAEGETIPYLEQAFTGADDWRAILPTMDFIAVCLPLTPATQHVIGAPELALMQPTAWLINPARGAIIDEPALIAALQARRIGGAALDVTTVEPLPADSPLWDLPNVILTPHVSWTSPEFDQRSLDLFFENLRRFRAGEGMINIVPPDVGY